jgi:hypothetical protein
MISFQVKFDIGLYLFTVLSIEEVYFVYLNYLLIQFFLFALMPVHLL